MTEQNQSPFRELSHAISSGNVYAIHAWFRDSGFKSGTDLSKKLCKHIANEPYFFSFSSNIFNKYELEKESLKRQLPVISYFNLQEQLSILSSISIDKEITIDHFKILNYSKNLASDRQNVLKDLGMHHLVTNIFYKEDFILLNKIEHILGLDIKNNRIDKIAIHYNNPHEGCFYLSNRKYNTCALDDIIFNYSELKAKYLNSNNIELPSFDYVNSLKEKIMEEIEESPYFNQQKYDKKVEEKIDNYFINYRYVLLNKNIIPKPEQTKKANKI